jgi:ABC-type nitrate/sulfonate/bicarbonate transport system permease component
VALIAAGAWEIYVRTKGSYATPTIPDILSALVELPGEDGFWSAIGGTLQALLIGYSLSLLVGVPLGILMGRVRPIGRIVNVYMTILLSVPLSAVVPIVVIVFGISLRARVAVIVLFALPVLVVNVMTGVAKVDRALLEMAASFGWRRAGTARKVIIPAALPEIFVGLRLGAGRAVVGMIVAELIVISVGIGKLIDYYTARFDMASTYAVVIVILAIAAVFLLLIRAVERRVLSWRLTIADTTN